MQPQVGPVSFRVRAFEQALAAGASSEEVRFRWPRDLFVRSLLLLPRSGLRADMAKLALQIVDETQQQIIFSGDGSNNFGGALSLSGCLPLSPMFADLVVAAPLALQRPVATGDLWLITARNRAAAGDPITPVLQFTFDEGQVGA